ncbi:cytochrome P450 [Niveispirillum sp. BGYR6]|uniref:cytochrome P450 n=1 Tax=Niveispirillum sp. BGYR6 TaxID=2971249 RepID=UPI0022B95662|nr:cytochrome P450 [Niveispirillum sp. BGYR6]MDG5493290.1 cytochrome P450 [Niveispirillum sp. BGYR6]
MSVAQEDMQFVPEMVADAQLYGQEKKLRAFHSWLQTNHPVVRVHPDGYRPFWVVSKFDDIRAIEAAPEKFLAAPRNVLIPIDVEQANLRVLGTPNGVTSLPQLDGEKHRALRALTQNWFMPKNLKTMQARIADLAREFVDRMVAMGGTCDFGEDIAFWYPLRVATTILGLPPEDEPQLLKMTQQLFAMQDPEVALSAEPEAVAQVISSFAAYFEAVTADRRANPREDVSTLIAHATLDGQELSPLDRISYYILVATAGHDTTSSSIAGGMQALAEFPDQWARLKANPDLCAALPNEAIRYTAPVKHFMRTTTEDVEIRGHKITAGENIFLSYDAACRDAEVFEDPHAFVIDRPNSNRHLAFGYGPHICLGQFLARMEIELFFRELVRRVDHVELAGPVRHMESSFVSGVKHLPIRYTVARAAV